MNVVLRRNVVKVARTQYIKISSHKNVSITFYRKFKAKTTGEKRNILPADVSALFSLVRYSFSQNPVTMH